VSDIVVLQAIFVFRFPFHQHIYNLAEPIKLASVDDDNLSVNPDSLFKQPPSFSRAVFFRPEVCFLSFRFPSKVRGARAPVGAVSESFTQRPSGRSGAPCGSPRAAFSVPGTGMLKVTGIQVRGTAPLSQKFVTYAWVQTGTYGRTADFKASRGEDPKSFLGVKNSDPRLFSMPIEMAANGFIIGVNFDNQPLDHMVVAPAADKPTQLKISECLNQLHARMKATIDK